MTPPAAAAAPRVRTQPRRAPHPRRVSGPVRGRAATAPPPLALRIGGAVHGIAEHRWLDRIIRGRAWIGILAVGLIGIVFMQVSMLRMNAGIGHAVDQASTLERQNATLRASVSELSSGDRIQTEAAKLGLVLPPAGSARFLDAHGFDLHRALASIQLPSHLAPLPVGTVTALAPIAPAATVAPVSDTTATPAAGTTAATPATGTTAATTPPATATTTPSSTTTPPATTQSTPTTTSTPAATTQSSGAASATPAAAPGTQSPTGGVSGGAG